MKTHLIVAVALALGAASPAFAASGHEHHQHASAEAKDSHKHGAKWATDAPLRKGMGTIRADLAATMPAVRARTLTAADARALGEKLEGQVGYIVANCKLEPEADAGLHVIVAELVAAADALKASNGADAPQAIARAVKATNEYGNQFDHPRWKGLAMPMQAALDLGEAVALIESTFPGRVIAAQCDSTGGDALHHHVDMQLPNGAVARFDVDGRTGRIVNRPIPEESTPPFGLQQVVSHVRQQMPGEIVAAEFDPDPRPHYHVNMRLPDGRLAKLELDRDGYLTGRER
jgi:uncharacterized membrane protein YkoI